MPQMTRIEKTGAADGADDPDQQTGPQMTQWTPTKSQRPQVTQINRQAADDADGTDRKTGAADDADDPDQQTGPQMSQMTRINSQGPR